jgi:hypothetical protein
MENLKNKLIYNDWTLSKSLSVLLESGGELRRLFDFVRNYKEPSHRRAAGYIVD